MRRQFILQCIALVFVAITVTSCGSTQLGKLDGRWKLVFLEHLELADEVLFIWEFGEDGLLTITQYNVPTPADPNPTPSVILRGSYSTKSGFSNATIHISDIQSASGYSFQMLSMLEYQTYSADWSILQINDATMRLGTDDTGGYVVREFEKEE